jgi:hypothetical protein
MRCPFCKSNKVKAVKEDLIVADDEEATGGRTSTTGLVYDESIFHYECENKHVFFGADPNIAEKNAEQRRNDA